MLEVVRTAGSRGLPRKKAWIGASDEANRSSSDFSTMPRLNSAATGFPCGSVVLIVTSISSPGRTGPSPLPVRFQESSTLKSRSTVNGLEAAWNRWIG